MQYGETTVMADLKHPQLRETVRYDYLMRYLPFWLSRRRNYSYAIISAVVGLLFLLKGIFIVSVVAFAAAAIFYSRVGLSDYILNSQRKIILAE